MEYSSAVKLIIVAAVMFYVLGGVTLLSHMYSLNRIKNKTVGAIVLVLNYITAKIFVFKNKNANN